MFELTELETQAGVNMEDVVRFAKRAIVLNGPSIVVDGDLAPALAGAVARYVGRDTYPGYPGGWEYAGHNAMGHLVYKKGKR